MSQFLLMYLTGKRLAIMICALVISQVGFSILWFISPTPTSVGNVLATRCLGRNSSNKWLYPRGKGRCDTVDTLLTETNEVVFAFQLPISKNNTDLEYSRWQQYLLGVLQLDMIYKPAVLTINARLAYRNKGDPDDAWQMYAASVEERVLYSNEQHDIPLFALGPLYHDYYLLNIRFPENKMNQVQDLWLRATNQNSGFTKVLVSLRTTFLSFIVNVTVTFWRRKRQVPRSPTLLEYKILSLVAAITFLNIPLEYLTLVLPMPFMLLLNDIRLGIFYATLLSFWLVFAGELLKIQDNTLSQSTFRCYWKHLSAVAIGCFLFFIFGMCEHGIQLQNPFFAIKTNLVLMLNIMAGIFASIYFFFLCYMIWKVFRNLNIKHIAQPTMSVAHLLIIKRFIYRLKFFMIVTVLCAAMTVTEFIVGRASERNGYLELEHTSTFYIVVYTLWNIYAGVVIIFCIPICPNVANSGTALESVS